MEEKSQVPDQTANRINARMNIRLGALDKGGFFVIWSIIVPALFLTLYTVIELQSLARSAAGSQAYQAVFLVSDAAGKISKLEKSLGPLYIVAQKNLEQKNASNDEWWLTRLRFLLTLNNLSSILGKDFQDTLCGLPLAETVRCAEPIMSQATREIAIFDEDQLKTDKDFAIRAKRASQLQSALADVRTTLAQFEAIDSDFGKFQRLADTSTESYNDQRQQYVSLTGSALTYEPNFPTPSTLSTSGNNAPSTNGNSTPSTGAATPAATPSASSNTSQTADNAPRNLAVGLPSNDLTRIGSIAITYNKLSVVPLIPWFFFLPSGAVVALFTGVMGAIGAVVYSLLNRVNKSAGAVDPTEIRFGVRPLLGAMSGFMVFFVVSAGAAFLVQPSVGGVSEAVNSLSPPALASLGLFAGLAAENALQWLKEKASGFFQTSQENTDGGLSGGQEQQVSTGGKTKQIDSSDPR